MSKLTIREGHYYRNNIDILVRIVGFVDPMSKEYALGFRYFDHRGSFYNEFGSTIRKIWASLDLIEQVDPSQVTNKEIEKIVNQWDRFNRIETTKAKIAGVFGRMNRITSILKPAAMFGAASAVTFKTLVYADAMYRNR